MAEVGGFALCRGGTAALVALRTGLFRLDLASGATVPIAPAPFPPATHRFNEAICDAAGRWWIGSMHDPQGRAAAPADQPRPMFRYTAGAGLVAAGPPSRIHNGFAWTPDGRALLWSHSDERTIHRAPYDPAMGVLGAPTVLARLPGPAGVPDGAAMDAEGGYWCAVNGAGVLRRYGPQGTLLREVRLPVSRPTMCAFIGAELDRLVVTTAREGLSPWGRLRERRAGALFVVRPGVNGTPKPCEVDC